MSWIDQFLGDNDVNADNVAHERKLRQIRRPAAAPSRKDLAQDAHIRTLEQENHELKIYLTALVRLLVRKGTVSREEIEELVGLAERVQKDVPEHTPDHRVALPALIEPVVVIDESSGEVSVEP